MLIEFRGIPAHARSITTARIILGTSCSDIVEVPHELVGDDCKRFFHRVRLLATGLLAVVAGCCCRSAGC